MGQLEKLKFKFWDPSGTTEKLINNWKPKKHNSEKDYEKSLYNFLDQHLDSIQITKQYARGRSKVDLSVGEKVFIELKYNLNSNSKYQRLIGQLVEYRKWNSPFIIILTGETDSNLFKQLVEFIEKENRVFFYEKSFILIKR